MRILNLEGRYFVRPWKEMGHDVLSIGSDHQDDLCLKTTLSLKGLLDFLKNRSFTPDVIFWGDVCRPPLVVGWERLPAVLIGYSIDQYCNPWHVPLSAAFDLFFIAQKDYLPMFIRQDIDRDAFWLPLFCDDAKDIDPGIDRDIPVSFVGTLEGRFNTMRRPFLLEVKKELPLIIKKGDYRPIFHRSRLILNQSAVGELNFRIFQGAACGACMVTEDVDNGLTELLTPKEEILVYPRGNAAQAVKVCRLALSDPERMKRIAQAGREKVLARHTDKIRAGSILAKAEQLLSSGRHLARRKNHPLIASELTKAYIFLATDSDLPLSSPTRQFFLNLAQSTQKQSQV